MISNTSGDFPPTEIIDGPYRIGSFTLHLISDGLMRLSGQSMFRTMDQVDDGPVPPLSQRPDGERKHTGRTLVGLNALLIQDGRQNILVDTGIGNKQEVSEGKSYLFERPRKLLTGLAELGVAAADVSHVINSHLHFDHCGGNTEVDEDGNFRPTFPNAVYHISRGEFEYAENPPPRERRDFPLVNILPILETGQLELWDHDGELLPGIEAITTGGHTRDHAIIKISAKGEASRSVTETPPLLSPPQAGGSKKGGEISKLITADTACFLADLIPTASHLHPSLVMKYDLFPEEVKQFKRSLLEQAARENWLLLFDHAPRVKAGYISNEGGRFVFRAV